MLPPSAQTALAAVLLVVGGLPHGASDHLVAGPAWRRRFAGVGLPLFLLAYLVLAALVFAVWWAWSALSLLAFLTLSAAHFVGEDAVGGSRWERAARGLMPIGLPGLAHPGDLLDLLRPLVAGSAADARLVAMAMGAAGIAALLALAGWWWRTRRLPTEVIGSALVLLVCPPLLGFALFFALVHSRRAAERRRSALGLSVTGYARACAPTVLGGAVVLAAAAWWLPDAGLAGWLIVGLAALTVPHMVLVPEAGATPT